MVLHLPPPLRLLAFIGCYWLLDAGYFQVPDHTLANTVYYHGVTQVCAWLINHLFNGENVSAFQNQLISATGNANLQVVRGCDGSGALFLLLAAIAAFPARLLWKLQGWFCGAVFVYAVNLIRISGLYFVVAYRPDWFELIHVYLAPTLIIILVCIFYGWWATQAQAYGPSTAAD